MLIERSPLILPGHSQPSGQIDECWTARVVRHCPKLQSDCKHPDAKRPNQEKMVSEDPDQYANAHVFKFRSSDKAQAALGAVRVGGRPPIMIFECELVFEHSAAGHARIRWRMSTGHVLYGFK